MFNFTNHVYFRRLRSKVLNLLTINNLQSNARVMSCHAC